MFRKGKEEALNSSKPNGSNGVSVNRCLKVYIIYTYTSYHVYFGIYIYTCIMLSFQKSTMSPHPF